MDYWLWAAGGEDWEDGVGARNGGWLGRLCSQGTEKGLVQQLLVADTLPFESVVPLPLLQLPDCMVRRPSLH